MISKTKAAHLFAADGRLQPSTITKASIAQTAAAGNPDYVCTHCGKPMSRCTCRYMDLVQSPTGWHWRTVAGPGALPKTSHAAYPTPLDAAKAGAFIAFYAGLPFRTGNNALKDALIAAWEIEGIEAARRGEPVSVCWNQYQRLAYNWARAA